MAESTEKKLTRREFLNWVLGIGTIGWIAAILYPVYKYIVPPKSREAVVKSVSVGKVKDFKPNSGLNFKFGNKPGILILTEDGTFKAFSATCTHLECTVQYKDEMKLIWCACHNGKYDLSGKNISGPPPNPLEEFKVIIKNNEVFVTKDA